jgi:5'-3' exonuclease
MYYVLRKMPPYEEANKAAWEEKLCTMIAAYMEELIMLEAPTKGVYVSCDGAVCAAKRRQQRLRRFKGPWASALERRLLNKPVVEGWDQNALTPGSAFMAKLGEVLTAAGKRVAAKIGTTVIVSTTAEPGEGEHKLLTHMRSLGTSLTSCTIYGLDADLILLAMLLGVDTGASVRLMREAQEFESSALAAIAEWRSLDVTQLATVMIPGCSKDRIRDFVACMSLLGNDFLPRSLTHTVRDDGIPELITALGKHVWTPGLQIVDINGSLDRVGLAALVGAWAAEEERDLVVAGNAALKASRFHPGIGASPDETALKEWNSQPARWATVAQILDPQNRNQLRPSWKGMYKSWHPGSIENYLQGLAWVWDYYSGRPVDQGWFFDEHLPPLWSDVAVALKDGSVLQAPKIEHPKPLPDWLHLLAVLPAESVTRLLPLKAQRLMLAASHYWPSSWSIYDVGKTQLWECEPVIPIIPEKVLRSWIKE